MFNEYASDLTGPERREVLRSGEVRILRQSDLLACPYVIMMPEHYRQDGRCRCDDPSHVEMSEWGYTWDGKCWNGDPEE